jgi:hypothetical protein
MLDAGDITHILTVTVRGGHLITGRTDEEDADPASDAQLRAGAPSGLSLCRRKRWEPLPLKAVSKKLADTMSHDLAAGFRLVLITRIQVDHLPQQLNTCGTRHLAWVAWLNAGQFGHDGGT